MGKVDSNDIEQISLIPVEVQLQICKEAALAFGYLCKAVCEAFGQEGVEVIEKNFLSGFDIMRSNIPHIEEDPSREVGMTLMKLLAIWGINKSSFFK